MSNEPKGTDKLRAEIAQNFREMKRRTDATTMEFRQMADDTGAGWEIDELQDKLYEVRVRSLGRAKRVAELKKERDGLQIDVVNLKGDIAYLEEKRDKYLTALEFIAESRKKQDAFGAIHISRESYTPVHDDSDMWNAALDALGIP